MFQKCASFGRLIFSLVSIYCLPLTINAAVFTKQDNAVYVWSESSTLIDSKVNDERFWAGLNRLGISRLLLSLSPTQINNAVRKPGSLKAFLRASQRHNVSTELLLGEPTWIDPKFRPNLIKVINDLSGFDFSGLHLDIEPHQIYALPLSDSIFQNWLKTYEEAVQASPWKVSASVHPLFFWTEGEYGVNMGNALAGTGLNEVTLMYYNSNPYAVINVVEEIINNAPSTLEFRIAQSIESDLPAVNSHWYSSRDTFEFSMNTITRGLAAKGNFTGLAFQSWEDFLKFGYGQDVNEQ